MSLCRTPPTSQTGGAAFWMGTRWPGGGLVAVVLLRGRGSVSCRRSGEWANWSRAARLMRRQWHLLCAGCLAAGASSVKECVASSQLHHAVRDATRHRWCLASTTLAIAISSPFSRRVEKSQATARVRQVHSTWAWRRDGVLHRRSREQSGEGTSVVYCCPCALHHAPAILHGPAAAETCVEHGANGRRAGTNARPRLSGRAVRDGNWSCRSRRSRCCATVESPPLATV